MKKWLKILGGGLTAVGTTLLIPQVRQALWAWFIDLPPAQTLTTLTDNVPVTMPDGVVLYGDHYAPKTGGSLPVILIRTPYGKRAFAPFASRYAERGYHVFVQDCRGCFASEGLFEPLQNERADGLATIDWLTQQPWCNGKVGMTGDSYVGYVQWAVAGKDAPPALQALVPIITSSQFYDFILPSNGKLFSLRNALSWTLVINRQSRTDQSVFGTIYDLARTIQYAQTTSYDGLPLIDLAEEKLGYRVPNYESWFLTPNANHEHWQRVDYRRHLPETTIPTHFLSGWYDIFLADTLSDFVQMQDAGHKPHITIYPYHHVDLRFKTDGTRDSFAWFEAHLKGRTEILRSDPVRLYLMGADRWLDFASWPPTTEPIDYFLHGADVLSTQRPFPHVPPNQYTYDPANPTPNLGGPLLLEPPVQDQRPLEARDDVLTYTSPPLEEPLTIIGALELSVYATSDAPSFDLLGRLCVVDGNGRSSNITENIIQLNENDGEPQADGTRLYHLTLWPTAYQFQVGQRLRLHICSGAFPRINRNLGKGEPLATAKEMQTATQTIYHDAEHPSVLRVPVLIH